MTARRPAREHRDQVRGYSPVGQTSYHRAWPSQPDGASSDASDAATSTTRTRTHAHRRSAGSHLLSDGPSTSHPRRPQRPTQQPHRLQTANRFRHVAESILTGGAITKLDLIADP